MNIVLESMAITKSRTDLDSLRECIPWIPTEDTPCLVCSPTSQKSLPRS
jgi:hypothetical protein